MKPHNKTQGFTLIELLVVIAIIGLLASIILASLAAAKNKANDQRLVSDMVSLRTAAETYRNSSGGYFTCPGYMRLTACTSTSPDAILEIPTSFFGTNNDGGGDKIMLDIANLLSDNIASPQYHYCSVSRPLSSGMTDSYSIRAALPSTINSGSPQYVCIDYTGAIITNYVGPTSGYAAYGNGAITITGPTTGPYRCIP